MRRDSDMTKPAWMSNEEWAEWCYLFNIRTQGVIVHEIAAMNERMIEVNLHDLLSQFTLVSLDQARELERMVYG